MTLANPACRATPRASSTAPAASWQHVHFAAIDVLKLAGAGTASHAFAGKEMREPNQTVGRKKRASRDV